MDETHTTKLIMHGPVKVSLEISFDAGDGNIANVNYALPPGRYPTPRWIENSIAECKANAEEQLGRKLKLLNREEFEQMLMQDLTCSGVKFAPSSHQWDKP